MTDTPEWQAPFEITVDNSEFAVITRGGTYYPIGKTAYVRKDAVGLVFPDGKDRPPTYADLVMVLKEIRNATFKWNGTTFSPGNGITDTFADLASKMLADAQVAIAEGLTKP